MARLFTDDQEQFIRDNAKGIGNQKLAELVNQKYNLNITYQQIKTWKRNHSVTSGLTGHYEKGSIPHNKGKKGKTTGRMAETQFKPGERPMNYKPVGSSRVDKDGYKLIKVRDDGPWHKRWRHEHKVIWEKENGPIPKGHVLIFLDGNRENISLENLKMITNRQLLAINRNGWKFDDKDLTETGILLADLSISMRTKLKGGEEE